MVKLRAELSRFLNELCNEEPAPAAPSLRAAGELAAADDGDDGESTSMEP
jgi:hypothetical protein